jgi:hypothetical protein
MFSDSIAFGAKQTNKQTASPAEKVTPDDHPKLCSKLRRVELEPRKKNREFASVVVTDAG